MLKLKGRNVREGLVNDLFLLIKREVRELMLIESSNYNRISSNKGNWRLYGMNSVLRHSPGADTATNKE